MVVAAGALGTNNLLANCKHSGALPRLSDRVGDVIRTNSESIQSVTARDDDRDFSRSVAITSSIYPDPDTHIEVVTYGEAGDIMSNTFTAMAGPGTRLTRPLKWLAELLRHPLQNLRMIVPLKWSRRTVILLVMQTVDAAMHLKPKRKLFGKGVRLQTEQDSERPNPIYLPAAAAAARWFASKTGGIAQSALTESIQNVPTTAHILGGAVVGAGRRERRRRHRQPRLRLREPAGHRRRRDAGQPRRQPEPDDHRQGRARDEPDPPQGGEGAAPPAEGGAAGDPRRSSLALSRRRRGAGRRSPS